MDKTIFLKNIKFLRDKLGFRQDEVAAALGMAERSYSNKENGKSAFRDTELFLLLELFKVDNLIALFTVPLY